MNTNPSIHPALADIPADKLFDVREISCKVKHPLIIERWVALPVDDYFVLVNGHAPEPLRYQFQALSPNAFRWDYLVNEDDLAAVRITRTTADPVAAEAPVR